ncbi:MAG: ComF family protein [Balneola sp.]|nr:ComF family protein [Balneola sp.]MBO6649551.1 ComF family protein [Balneola sp.]MBO6711368.1 ComF family protein [Balneola sp.]MBO6801278.1 ComF family protein [Balneola sp.]MBO6869304.1 ComF family protein [Balneola sp.]
MFPKVCAICGFSLSKNQNFLCNDCSQNRFERAVSSRADKINLPESVTGRFALWQFDKGGYLQDLLHKLKYHRLTGVGEDLGSILGNTIKKEQILNSFNVEETKILPVPLHRKKRKLRGFNQAFFIAKGFSGKMEYDILKKGVVERIKNTKTQTRFTLNKRRENIAKAFSVAQKEEVVGKNIIIIDDVFTTGATAFELVSELENADVGKIFIVTVAQA